MRLRLVTPAPRGSRSGNRITARRWAAILRSLGHTVIVEREYRGGPAEVLIALHARKSHASVVRFKERVPHGRVIVALTGTDLYVDLGRSAEAQESVRLADRLVVLQPLAVRELPSAAAKRRARVIFQSVERVPKARPLRDVFEVCVVGHLRPVKDPFRAALAARSLPAQSRVKVTHVGAALSAAMARAARAQMRRNPRYVWVGEKPWAEALRLLARARVLVVSSLSEGGANVISEAVTAGVPVLASRVPGNVGLLGPGYPGYFPARSTHALTLLLRRVEEDVAFRRILRARCVALAPRFRQSRERALWRRLLAELSR